MGENKDTKMIWNFFKVVSSTYINEIFKISALAANSIENGKVYILTF